MRLLLDSNVLLWTLAGTPRIEPIRDLLLAEDSDIFVSTAGWWEIAIKIAIGKLDADLAALRRAAAASGFAELPVLGAHVEALARLPPIHRDPFDRMIVAQALAEPMRLLTGDALLARYSELVRVV